MVLYQHKCVFTKLKLLRQTVTACHWTGFGRTGKHYSNLQPTTPQKTILLEQNALSTWFCGGCPKWAFLSMEIFLNGDKLIKQSLEQPLRNACHTDVYILDIRDTYTNLDLSPKLHGGKTDEQVPTKHRTRPPLSLSLSTCTGPVQYNDATRLGLINSCESHIFVHGCTM